MKSFIKRVFPTKACFIAAFALIALSGAVATRAILGFADSLPASHTSSTSAVVKPGKVLGTETGITLANLTAPAPDNANPPTLSGSTVTFSWSAVNGAAKYWLDVGNSAGQGDISAGALTETSKTVSNIPVDGRPIYIQLWTQYPTAIVSENDGWGQNHNQYTFTAYNNSAKTALAQLTDPKPANSSPPTLSGGTITFSWSAPGGADNYWLDVGTVQGQGNISAGLTGNIASKTVSGIPTNGQPVWIRLWTHPIGHNYNTYDANGWGPGTVYNDYVFKAYNGGTKAELQNPPPGSQLSASNVTFNWSVGMGATKYWLDVGNSQGQGDISAGELTAASKTVSGLPNDGRTLYIRLWSYINGSWGANYYDYTVRAANNSAKNTNQVTGLKAEDEGTNGRVYLSWDQTPKDLGANLFYIFRKQGQGGSYQKLDIAALGNVYEDAGLTNNTNYYYKIVPYNINTDKSGPHTYVETPLYAVDQAITETNAVPTATKDPRQEDLIMVVPDTYPAAQPDYRQRLGDLVAEINSVYAKNTSKQFVLKDVRLYKQSDFCDYSLASNQCASLVGFKQFYSPGAVTTFFVAGNMDIPTNTAFYDSNPAQHNIIYYNVISGHPADFNTPLILNPKTDTFAGIVSHELGHSYGLGTIELYNYRNVLVCSDYNNPHTCVDPLGHSVMPDAYQNDPMYAAANPVSSLEFGPLDAYIINHDLDHSNFNTYRITNAQNMPASVKINVKDTANKPVNGALVQVFCSSYRGTFTKETSPRFTASTDFNGNATLQQLSYNSSVMTGINGQILGAEGCDVNLVKVIKTGFNDNLSSVITLQLQEAKVVNGLNEYNINVYMFSPSSTATLVSPVTDYSLTGSSQTFSWNAVPRASDYWLDVGNSLGHGDISAGVTGGATSKTVFNIPTDGRKIYVRLWTRLPNVSDYDGWGHDYLDYTFTTYDSVTTGNNLSGH